MLTNSSYHHYTRYPRQLKIQKKKKERKGIGTERKCDGIGRRKVKHYHTMHSLHKSFELLKVVSLHENRAKPEIGKNR
jgi:hypothetical protein